MLKEVGGANNLHHSERQTRRHCHEILREKYPQSSERPKAQLSHRAERRGHNTLAVENLEHRNLLSTSTVVASTAIVISPLAKASTPVGYSPAQLRTAYGFTGLTFNGGKAANGSGETIAIVDAYNDPNIAKDLAAFDTEYGLAAANLAVVSQTGGSVASLSTDAGWALETSLDVEWAHAIAPGAKSCWSKRSPIA